MDLRILGPLEVYDDDGRAIELGGRQQRLVLAMLLLHRNEVVSVDRLIDAVWGERAPGSASKNIQIHVSRLRKALEAPAPRGGTGSRKALVRTHANGYALEVAPDELDLDRFQGLVEKGRRALAGDEPEKASTTLREALALWRGAPLADFAYDSFAQGEISRLEELRLAAVEDRIEADLALGREEDIIAELQGLATEHPLRERLRGQLMLALYRSGRKAEALRVYDETRRGLAEELGLEPSASLQELQRAVLTDDPSLAAPVTPSKPRPARVGREPARADLRKALLGVGGALLLAAALAVAGLAVTRDRTTAGIVSVAPNSVAAIDPETNRVVAEIPVGARPASVVSAHGALWVANLDDDTVSRIDPDTNVVTETIEVGTGLAGIVVAEGLIWVTSQESGSRPPADAVSTNDTARFTAAFDFETDPARYPDRQINYATCAKLLNYPDAPAPTGTRLVPEVAASLPARSPDGRTYTFTIREGFAFSPPLRERVTAQTFKHAIERSLHPRMGGAAGAVVTDIVGQSAYEAGKTAHLSDVVVKDDKLSITLEKPAPDFLARIASSFFCAVPLNAPIDPKGVRELPSAGPYYIAEHEPNQRIVLARNPNYEGSRPRRLREIQYTIGVGPAKNIADVEAGRSDYVVDGVIPVDRETEAALAARYGPTSAAARSGAQRYFVNPTLALAYLALNASRPLFSNARLRRAVNYAIDRRALARHGNFRISGPFPAIPTDQYIPPNMPGASRASVYPPSGDLRTARRLAPDVRGTAVLYTCNLQYCRRHAQVIESNLAALGLGVEVRKFPLNELVQRATTKGEPFDIITAHWAADYADPSDFLNVLLSQQIESRGNLNLSYLTGARLVSRLERAARLTGEARYRGYEKLSVQIARDDAPWVAYATGTARDFFSARMGCQLFHPVYGMDLATLCVRRNGG